MRFLRDRADRFFFNEHLSVDKHQCHGAGFDLPMAMGIVGAYGGLTKTDLSDFLFVGELSLDGGVRGVRGTLPIAIEARAKKIKNLIVPEPNAREAAVEVRIEPAAYTQHFNVVENLAATYPATLVRI